jgi:copper homeostasis protein (lipoprotein)
MIHSFWEKLVWSLILSGWLLCSPAGAASFPDIGKLPASFEGELPGAGNPIIWHLDLFPEGRYQLRLTYVGRPEPNRFDDIGRWVEDSSGCIVLKGSRDAPIFLMPEAGGASLRKLDTHGRPIHSSYNDRLVRLPEFRPIEPQLRLTGMFTYLADAAVITLCADGRQLPVAMENDYIALERAYLQAYISPGQPGLVSVDGLITQRPSMEESQPPRPTLVVERYRICGSFLEFLSGKGNVIVWFETKAFDRWAAIQDGF